MATFPSITPTYGQQKRSSPNTRTVRFADGYEHRILFGLAAHQNPKVFNFTFNVSETDADTIEGFLDSRANDSASFTFTPPGEGFTKTGTYSQSGTTVTITITGWAGVDYRKCVFSWEVGILSCKTEEFKWIYCSPQ